MINHLNLQLLNHGHDNHEHYLHRLQQLEAVVDGNFNIVFKAINELMAESE